MPPTSTSDLRWVLFEQGAGDATDHCTSLLDAPHEVGDDHLLRECRVFSRKGLRVAGEQGIENHVLQFLR